MHRRINVTLPEETIRLLDRVGPRGNRSRLIDQAVRHYLTAASRRKLREGLKQGAIRRAEQDRRLANEWFSVDEDAWTKTRE